MKNIFISEYLLFSIERGTLESVLYSTKLPLSTKLHLAIQTADVNYINILNSIRFLLFIK